MPSHPDEVPTDGPGASLDAFPMADDPSIQALTWIRYGLTLVAAIVYFAVGRQVSKRPVSPDALLAKRAFEFWWYGLAGLSLFTPAIRALDMAGLTESLPLVLLLVQVLLIVIVFAIGGLTFYLLYLYSGKRGLMAVVVAYFVVLLAWLETLIAMAQPVGWGVPPQGGAETILYNHDFAGKPAAMWLGLLLIAPMLLSAIAYSLLLLRVHDRMSRYRIAMVSGALVVWSATSVVGTILGMNREHPYGWPVFTSLVSVCASLVIFIAYKPTKGIQTWLERGRAAGKAA